MVYKTLAKYEWYQISALAKLLFHEDEDAVLLQPKSGEGKQMGYRDLDKLFLILTGSIWGPMKIEKLFGPKFQRAQFLVLKVIIFNDSFKLRISSCYFKVLKFLDNIFCNLNLGR